MPNKYRVTAQQLKKTNKLKHSINKQRKKTPATTINTLADSKFKHFLINNYFLRILRITDLNMCAVQGISL